MESEYPGGGEAEALPAGSRGGIAMATAAMLAAAMLSVEGPACWLQGTKPQLSGTPTSPLLLQAVGGDGGRLPSAAGEEQEGVQRPGQQMPPL